MKLALFFLLSFGLIAVLQITDSAFNVKGMSCKVQVVYKKGCEIFDFTKENCKPWATDMCPDPDVILKMSACDVFTCVNVSSTIRELNQT